MKLICCLAPLSIALLIGCGKTAPDQQTTPKVEPTEAALTPGMEAAKKAHDEGRYADAVRLYTAELATEEAKSTPSWVQLSYLNNELGLALDAAGQYDHALEYYQKSLAIDLKQLGPDHPDVATSYNNIGLVYKKKGEYDKALEYY
jgi:tetratricopeptide (TPR) repeat protein